MGLLDGLLEFNAAYPTEIHIDDELTAASFLLQSIYNLVYFTADLRGDFGCALMFGHGLAWWSAGFHGCSRAAILGFKLRCASEAGWATLTGSSH